MKSALTTTTVGACPDDDVVAEFVAGELPAAQARELHAHIDQCGLCRAALAELARAPQTMALGQELNTTAGPTLPASPPERSDGRQSLGRFMLTKVRGSGGMGVVYLAYDPKLRRNVAVKLLHAQDPDSRERLEYEAQTMAQLTHPNVITVYDVGSVADQVFIAMEYVDGATLREWLQSKPSWREKVRVYLEAGEGLAAAHDAGLVHRDFKPDNVLIGKDGRVQVTDFGLARQAPEASQPTQKSQRALTATGSMVGTPAYMPSEQFTGGRVDARSDQFSYCVSLWEALFGQRPFAGDSLLALQTSVSSGDIREPPASNVPTWLPRLLERGLAADPSDRFPSMDALLMQLSIEFEPRFGRQLAEGESPFPGLAAFQETDADRFFGRERDVSRLTRKLDEQPFVTVVGLAGAGKSSLVRAGLVPSLKSTGEWDVRVLRPGHSPLRRLAQLMARISQAGEATSNVDVISEQLRHDPGLCARATRRYARDNGRRLLIVVDQLEELYTLGADSTDRRVFAAALLAAAFDISSAVRVVATMRSDLLDKAAGDSEFVERIAPGLLFLAPPGPDGLKQALVRPVELIGFRFETESLVDDMVHALKASPGALPLLQFVASKLWSERDRTRQLLTVEAYRRIGAIEGALAGHADQVLAALPAEHRRLARTVLVRLVTADRTRDVVPVDEIERLGQRTAVQNIIQQLVAARLLVSHSRDGDLGPVVEIIHESLINGWPTLRRWLDEGAEDVAYMAQVVAAAKQWRQKSRGEGLLWRGEAAEEALFWRRRYGGFLSEHETEFLDAVASAHKRSARRRRFGWVLAFVVMSTIIVGGAITLLVIRDAAEKARGEATRARAAERQVNEQLSVIKAEKSERAKAENVAKRESARAATGEKKLEMTNDQLRRALTKQEAAAKRAAERETAARSAEKQATDAAARERKAKEEYEKLYRKEQKRARELKKRRKKIFQDLD